MAAPRAPAAGARALVTISKKAELRDWLEGRDRADAQVIAARAALRVLPFSATAIGKDGGDVRRALFLPIFRALSLSISLIERPLTERESFASAAAAANAYSAANAAAAAANAYSAAYSVGTASNAAANAANAAYSAATAAAAAASDIWRMISIDAEALECGVRPTRLTHKALCPDTSSEWTDETLGGRWPEATPDEIARHWTALKKNLLTAKDGDWRVWTDWYEARLRGAPFNEDLEYAKAVIADEIWDAGPKAANAEIRRLMRKYAPASESLNLVDPPPQRRAVLEAEWRDGLIRRRSEAPEIDSEAQAKRLRDAWQTLRDATDDVLEAEPGRNWSQLSKVIGRYDRAVGSTYAHMNVIGVGMIGDRLLHLVQSDECPLLEEDVASLDSFMRMHGPFIQQFPDWQEYLNDAFPRPSAEEVRLSAQVSIEIAQHADFVDEEVATLLKENAEDVDEPSRSVGREIVSGLSNVLSTFFSHIGKNAYDGLGSGVKKFVETGLLVVGGLLAVWLANLAALPGSSFAWLVPWLTAIGVRISK